MKKINLFISLIILTGLQAQEPQQPTPTVRQFVRNNTSSIAGTLCLTGATALIKTADNEIVKGCASIMAPFLAFNMAFDISSSYLLQKNLATPAQLLLFRVGKIAALLYSFKFYNSSQDYPFTLAWCALGLVRNTLGLPRDIVRTLETI